LLKIVRQYHLSLGGQDASTQGDAAAAEGLQQPVDDAGLEKSLTAAEMSSARWAWDWLRSRPQILINGNKRWNRLELSEALALPETDLIDPAIVAAAGDGKETDKSKGKKTKKALTTRPRIHPSEDLVWQTLTRHGVDYKRVPALEWACLQGIASARAEGILQSDLRRLVDQDKRSLPKRTDSLARKGYVAKRTVVVQKMKTSRLWLIDFAPPLVEEDKCGLDLTPETLSKDLEPVPWHKRWSENNIDMDALGRTVVGVVKAFHVIRYADLRLKMGVSGKRWQMKTLAKNCQRLVDVGVLKYTAASFAESRKVFKDCLKFVREPTAEEWDKFLATGKKTSLYSDPTRHREPKPNALALYGKSGEDGQGTGAARSKLKRIFSGWIPEKPLAQTVFEVIRRAGPEGASNPQVSVATVGYQHRRYLSSYLTKVAETQQPPHLNKFQVDSKLVRTGKTSAYMFSAPRAAEQAALALISEAGSSDSAPADPYGFGAARPKAFSAGQDFSLSDMSKVAKKSRPSTKRKLLPRVKPQHLAAAEAARAAALKQDAATAAQGDQSAEPEGDQGLKRTFDEITNNTEGAEDGAQEQFPSSTPATFNEAPRAPADEDLILNVRYNGLAGKLQVHRADRHVTFLRSGRGLKKPFIIPVDDNLDEPAIRDVPGSEEKSLVLATGEKDGKPAWTSVFIFDDEGQDNAVWIQQEIIKMKSPDYEPSPAEIPDASEEITVGLALPGAARGKARGRGGSRAAGRGKGKKGRNLPAGAKPYVCALCGNAWKNDIGLKYHLEKAQVPCNPNFDPAILLERARKRRKPSPAQPSMANSEAGDDGPSGRTLKPRGGRKGEKKAPRLQLNVRIAMRSAQDPAHKFRGLSATDGDNVEEPESWVSERPKEAFRSTASVHTGEHASGPEVRGSTGANLLPVGPGPLSNVGSRPSMPMGMASYPGPVSGAENDASRSVLAAIDQGASGMAARDEQSELLQSLPTAPATPTRSRASEDAPATNDKTSYRNALDDFTLRPTNGTPLFNRHADISPSRAIRQQEPYQSDYPDLAPQQMEQEPEDEFRAGTTMSQNAQRISKPFVRSSNYERMASEAKRRTAQAFDIIAYLLDNNLGVFPGDKALFYALTNVFLREFPKQMPPTWKNFTGAVKAVESRKLAAVHTHMLKTERGRLQTCTLLIRTGVDANGIIATKMKQKMRETYPGIFIPPAFSPTQDELVLLQELDKKVVDVKPNANGQKFRSRRKIEEIETFNAPYYKNTAPVAAPKRDPLWIRETERLFDDGYTDRKRSADDDDSAGPLHKRARNGFPDDEYGDIPVDPEIMGDPMSPSQHGQREGPSVLEAIKAYSLLPAKLGPRGRRRPSFSYKPLAKLPRELGRVKNPGLDSLPGIFFGRNANSTAIQFVSPEVLILDPNTNLDEDHDWDEEDQGQSQGSSRESSEDALDRPEVEEGAESTEATTEGAKTFNFAWPAVLEPSPEGSWPNHPLKYFEHHDGSFTVNGWMPSQTWLLTQNIPSSAEEMADKQRAKKIKLRGWVDREYARFCSVVNQCAAWEQSRPGTAVMSGSSVVPDYYFINVSSPASRAGSRAVGLRWSDETQYDLETLPYEELEDDDYGDVIYIEDGAERTGEDGEPSPKRRRGVQKTAAGQPKRTKGGRPPKLKLAAIKTMREHTSYPKTADDLLRQDDNDDLDWSSENVRLAAFIVVTTLLGGVDKVVDWGLMLRLMPNQT
jgi:transcription factor C subunit 3